MACTFLDPMTFVPFSFPDVVECRDRHRGCPCPCPRPFRYPRIDYTREFFCNKWGPSFRCICPPQKPRGSRNRCGPYNLGRGGAKQFRGVGREMESLDYFSALPWRREGRFVGIRDLPTFQQDEGMAWVNPCPKYGLCYSQTCTQGTRLKPDLIKDDNACGICAPVQQDCKTPQDPFKCDDFPGFDISGRNLGFRVEVMDWPRCDPPKIRTGVERCIQPSRYRDFTTVYQENYQDFMKTKTPKQILLYRSPLAIDKRRPGPKIPCDTNTDCIVGVNKCPISVCAKAIKYQVCKKRPCPPCLPKKPDFEVILPGAICLP